MVENSFVGREPDFGVGPEDIAKGEAILERFGYGDRVDEMVTRNGRTIRAGNFLEIEHCRPILGLMEKIDSLPEGSEQRIMLEEGATIYIGKFFPEEEDKQ